MTAHEDEWVVTAGEGDIRLDRFLAAPERLGSRARAAAALERGKVFLNGDEASIAEAARPLTAGDTVRVWIDRPGSSKPRPRGRQAGDLHVVYEDDVLMGVNKPAGLLTVPLERKPGVPSLYERVEDLFRSHGKRRPLIVHRIDQDTSGLVLFAKEAQAHAHLKRQFRRREPQRVYLAVVNGRPDPPSGTWRDRLVWDERALIQKETHERDSRGTEAISEYRVVEPLREASLIEVRLRTGRRNQVRIQAQLRGHPLVGEERYIAGSTAFRRVRFPRHALHAWRLVFRHPVDGRRMDLEVPPPRDFADLVERLRVRS